jgi:cadmium resistance protein CadD (predicted permease)
MKTTFDQGPVRTTLWQLWTFALSVLLALVIGRRVYQEHHADNIVSHRLLWALAFAFTGIVLGLVILFKRKSLR